MYVNSTTQRCPTKYLNLFKLKIFPFATGVNDTSGDEFSTKFETALMGYSGALMGKLIHEKNLMSRISWHCPFKLAIIAAKHGR